MIGSAELLGTIRKKRDHWNYAIGGSISAFFVTLYTDEFTVRQLGRKVVGMTVAGVLYSHLFTQYKDFEQYTKDTGHKKSVPDKLKQLFGLK